MSFALDAAGELLGHRATHLEKEPAHHLQNVRLVHDGDLLAPLPESVLERVAHDSLAALARHDRHGLADGARIVTDLHEVLDPDIQSLEVLAHEHDIDVLESPAGNDRLGGADVGEELERLAKSDVHRAEPGADGRRERSLERDPVLPDAVDRRVRKRRTGRVHRRHPRQLVIPVEAKAGGLEHLHGLCGDLGSDPVAGDERDVVRHGPIAGRAAASAAASAAKGVAPLPIA